MKMVKNFDTGSLIVILVTFVLFALALFTKGFATIFFWKQAFSWCA